MRERKPPRSFLEPDMVVDLLDVAGEWEASLPGHQRVGRRGLLALLCLAGPRVGELIAADRGDFDLAAGRWRIPEAKTDSGRRDVELTMYLRDELVEHVASMDGLGRAIGARAPLFSDSIRSATGPRRDRWAALSGRSSGQMPTGPRKESSSFQTASRRTRCAARSRASRARRGAIHGG